MTIDDLVLMAAGVVPGFIVGGISAFVLGLLPIINRLSRVETLVEDNGRSIAHLEELINGGPQI